MPNIAPHMCRHIYCSNQAKAGMNPKTLQYLMGSCVPVAHVQHRPQQSEDQSDIGVTTNVYTHLEFKDVAAETARLEQVETVRKEQGNLRKNRKQRKKSITGIVQGCMNGNGGSSPFHGGGSFFDFRDMV